MITGAMLSYTNEIFYRFWYRPDTNVDRTGTSPAKILRIFNPTNDINHLIWAGLHGLVDEGVKSGII